MAATPSSTVHRPFSSPSPSSTVYRPSSSPTPVPCDPSTADYCIVDGNFLLQRPIAPPGTDSVDRSYPYGSTAEGTRDPHHGVEFYNASGTPVLAAADGTVYYAGNDTERAFSTWLWLYGNIVILEHPLTGAPFDRLYTLYAHLSKMDVSVGQAVRAGEKIGEVGMTGTASGSHLHFEVRLDPDNYNSTLNPELRLVPLTGTGVLSMRFVDENGQFVQAQPNVQYYPDPIGTFTQAWQPENYNPELSIGNWENAVLGDLPAGRYRVTYLWAGIIYERWVEIQPGKLTRVMFVVK